MDSQSSTCVAGLFGQCDVTAIVWFVIAVYIIAFNGQLFSIAIGERPISKRFELLPFVANVNSSSTVVFICGVAKSVATSFHALPNSVKPVGLIRTSHSVCEGRFTELCVMPVLRFCMARFQASAIGRNATGKVIANNPFLFPANTLAQPISDWPRIGFGGSVFVGSDHSPVIELLVS